MKDISRRSFFRGFGKGALAGAAVPFLKPIEAEAEEEDEVENVAVYDEGDVITVYASASDEVKTYVLRDFDVG